MIPAPPETINAPVEVDVAAEAFEMVVIPLNVFAPAMVCAAVKSTKFFVDEPVPPFAMSTIPDTLVAVPDKVPVIIFAVKLPLASLATIALAVFAEVAVVAELLTFPAVAIVDKSASVILPTYVNVPLPTFFKYPALFDKLPILVKLV